MNATAERRINMKRIFIISILFFFAFLILFYLNDLPEIVMGTIANRFVEKSVEETGSLNVVTAILYDYRAFDSLGESTVLFAAVSGIVLVLSRKMLPVSSHGLSILVKRNFGILTPFIALFSLYIITHGHLSPGGGFQGGVILGVISIIFSIVYGSAFDYERYSPQLKTTLETGGALLFIFIGIMGIVFEGVFLDNVNFLNDGTGTLISSGSILVINLGVGLKIGAGLAIIFYSMIQKTFGEGLE